MEQQLIETTETNYLSTYEAEDSVRLTAVASMQQSIISEDPSAMLARELDEL